MAGALALAPLEAGAAEPGDSNDGSVVDERAREEHRRRTNLQLAGMGVLTGWSVANLAGGLAGNFTTEGTVRFFHQGNWAWNTVNLILGAVNLARETRKRKRPISHERGVAEARKARLVYVINASLDVVYVGAGAVMWQLARTDERAIGPRLTGYGQALVLQGAFLVGFDAAMAVGHELLLARSLRERQVVILRPHVGPRIGGGVEFGLSLRW